MTFTVNYRTLKYYHESMYIYTELITAILTDMRKIISALACIAIMTSCNQGDKKTKATPESSDNDTTMMDDASEKDNDQFVEISTDEALIATAIMAAPAGSRSGSTVIGYNMAGEFVTLKEGDNEFICLADDPKRVGFSAACYHKDLEPFMARGRVLRAEGKTGAEIFDIREAEAKSGALDMGEAGSTLHIYYGGKSLYNPETSEVADAQYRYVVYLPWATSESTGLSENPIAKNHPWIMNPGTHKAHIMISPVSDEKLKKE